MRDAIAGLLIFLATPNLSAGEAPAPASRSDLDRLQGAWSAKAGPNREIDLTLEVRGRSFALAIAAPAGLRLAVRGELNLDETATPRAADWTRLALEDGQELPDHLAIYQLEGDTLKLRSGGPNDPRPREFRPGPGLVAGVVVFTRKAVTTAALQP